MSRTLRVVRPRLAAETLLHFRWETFAAEAMDDVAGWLEEEPRAILAFNDHLTPLIDNGFMARKIDKAAARAGHDARGATGRWRKGCGSAATPFGANVARVAEMARRAGAVLLAHDETSPEMRTAYRAIGACACEFPMTAETARAARAAGEHVILGAPNVLRGGSHNNAMPAAEAVLAGECTVLTSDYYYPAPLIAPFLLARLGMDLVRAWALVSTHAAATAGLADRGRLATGLRADVILVDASGDWPEVRAVWVGGRQVLRRF